MPSSALYCSFPAKVINISRLRKKRCNIMFFFKKNISSWDFSWLFAFEYCFFFLTLHAQFLLPLPSISRSSHSSCKTRKGQKLVVNLQLLISSISQQRNMNICYLMKNTNMTIQQIACELSFPNASSFGTFFKKYTGLSPKNYRIGGGVA